MSGIKGMGTPKALTPPVPGDDIAGQVMSDLANSGQPAVVPAQSVQAAPLPEDDPLAALSAQYSAPDESDPLAALAQQYSAPEQAAAPTSGFDSFMQDVKGQALNAFATSDEQKQAVLSKTYGAENVRKQGHDWQFKKEGKWQDADRGFWQLYKDLIGTNPVGHLLGIGEGVPGVAKDIAAQSKNALVETVALPGEVAATFSPVPGSMFAARMAGGAAGEFAAQKVASAAGVPDDPNVGAQDALIHGTARAVLGQFFHYAGEKLGGLIAGRTAAKAARQAEHEMSLQGTSTEQALEAANATEEVRSAWGRMFGRGKSYGEVGSNPAAPGAEPGQIPGGILPHHMNTDNQDFSDAAANVANSKQGQEFLSQFGQAVRSAWDKTGAALTSLSGGQSLGRLFGEKVDATRQAFGATIGRYRKEFVDAAGDQLFKAETFENTIKQLANQMGHVEGEVDKAGNWVKPKAWQVAEKLGIGKTKDNIVQLQQAIDFVWENLDKSYNSGGMYTAQEIVNGYQRFAIMTDNAFKNKSLPAYSWMLRKVTNSMQDDLAIGIHKTLSASNPAAKDIYTTAMKEYRSVNEALKVLKNQLKNDDMTPTALAKALISDGAAGLDKVRAAKTLIQKETDDFMPQPGERARDLWDDVHAGFMKHLTNTFHDADDAARQWGSMKWGELESHLRTRADIIKEAFGDVGYQSMLDAAILGRQAQNGAVTFTKSPPPLRKRFMGALGELAGISPKEAAKMLSSGYFDKKAQERYLTSEGRKELMKLMPEADHGAVNQTLDLLAEMSKTAVSPIPSMQTSPVASGLANATSEKLNDKRRQAKP